MKDLSAEELQRRVEDGSLAASELDKRRRAAIASENRALVGKCFRRQSDYAGDEYALIISVSDNGFPDAFKFRGDGDSLYVYLRDFIDLGPDYADEETQWKEVSREVFMNEWANIQSATAVDPRSLVRK